MKAIALLLALALAGCNTGWGPDAFNLTTKQAPLGEDGSINCDCWIRGCWSLQYAGLMGQKMTTIPEPGEKLCYVISVREKWLARKR